MFYVQSRIYNVQVIFVQSSSKAKIAYLYFLRIDGLTSMLELHCRESYSLHPDKMFLRLWHDDICGVID